MACPSKAKGNRWERQFVQLCKLYNLEAERAYGSNGKALGFTEDVDVAIALPGKRKMLVQCKSRKKLPQIIRPVNTVDVQAVKENGGTMFAIVPINLFLQMLESFSKSADQFPNIKTDKTTSEILQEESRYI